MYHPILFAATALALTACTAQQSESPPPTPGVNIIDAIPNLLTDPPADQPTRCLRLAIGRWLCPDGSASPAVLR